ncbi:MAG: hypothetical protein V1757_10035 [Actinomycetota bacterium]|jgi:hypothetical protein
MTTPRRVRDRVAPVVIFTALTLSPVTVPWYRLDIDPPPAAVLVVGEPTPRIDGYGRH